MIQSINPATEEVIREYSEESSAQIQTKLEDLLKVQRGWRGKPVSDRVKPLKKLAALLEERAKEYAELIESEMGKKKDEAEAEVKKCALLCRYYEKEAPGFLADEKVEEGKLVAFEPLGCVFGIMPWNFPFWQVFRFAVPAIAAGNGALLKHASNVSGCALAIEGLFKECGFPPSLFQVALVPGKHVEKVIESPLVHAVTLTGSEKAGKSAAKKAGEMLKKTVLELGGSDPFIVLEDADLDQAVETAASARLMNCGQSCIAAKRFFIHRKVYAEFRQKLLKEIESKELAPMARKDLRDAIHKQVEASIKKGARLLAGGVIPPGKGWFYPATLLEKVAPGMEAFDEETFGPMFALIEVDSEQEAIELANKSPYGLGGAVWTKDLKKGELVARQIDSGTVVVNGKTASDPKLPFGGIKLSGYGRELSHFGIKEFVNIKTLIINS